VKTRQSPMNFAAVVIALTLAACGGGTEADSPTVGILAAAPTYELDGTWRNPDALAADAPEISMTLTVDSQGHVTGSGTWRAGLRLQDSPDTGPLTVTGMRHDNEVNLQITESYQNQTLRVLNFAGVISNGSISGSLSAESGPGIPFVFERMYPN
jgi:hypothetical protein